MDSDIVRFLVELSDSVRNLLKGRFVGSYLHGSLSMSAFQPVESDIDVVITVDASLADSITDDLRELLDGLPVPRSAAGLDLGLLATEHARHLTKEACWEASIQVRRLPAGQKAHAQERSDPFLYLDVAALREHGIALAGPAIRESFGPVAPGLVLSACAENIRVWASRDVFHDAASGVLNACRAWRYLEEGILTSKPEAGAWASARLENRTLVDAALARRGGDTSRTLADAEVKDFCRSVLWLLENRGAD